MSHRLEVSTEIGNGAKCKSYRWSQSYSDLEIRVKLHQVVKYENVDVFIDSRKIKIVSRKVVESRKTIKELESLSKEAKTTEILIEGKFQHPVDTESAFWLLDNEEPCIVIYMDKKDNLWWKKLLVDEEVTEAGPKYYTVSMDHMDDGSRMAIDKLIADQRKKLENRASHQYS